VQNSRSKKNNARGEIRHFSKKMKTRQNPANKSLKEKTHLQGGALPVSARMLSQLPKKSLRREEIQREAIIRWRRDNRPSASFGADSARPARKYYI